MAELQRVVAPGGHLLFSGPIGRPRVCFNAHRIHDPIAILEHFGELELVEFAVVDDSGRFTRHRDPAAYRDLTYGCGMFLLRRPETADAPAFEVPADMEWAFEGGEFVERDVTALFDELMAETATGAVYDVGANCGWFAVRAARAGARCAPSSRSPRPPTSPSATWAASPAPTRAWCARPSPRPPGSATIHLYSSSGNNSLHERTLPPGHPLRRTGDLEVSGRPPRRSGRPRRLPAARAHQDRRRGRRARGAPRRPRDARPPSPARSSWSGPSRPRATRAMRAPRSSTSCARRGIRLLAVTPEGSSSIPTRSATSAARSSGARRSCGSRVKTPNRAAIMRARCADVCARRRSPCIATPSRSWRSTVRSSPPPTT